jgi:hypothetical protein
LLYKRVAHLVYIGVDEKNLLTYRHSLSVFGSSTVLSLIFRSILIYLSFSLFFFFLFYPSRVGMVTRSLFEAALGVTSLLALATTGDALYGAKTGASPGYRGSSSLCPERCSVAGPNTGNWSVYPDIPTDQTIRLDHVL